MKTEFADLLTSDEVGKIKKKDGEESITSLVPDV
jgi:hypothetical protein